jgi:hypothetical protein
VILLRELDNDGRLVKLMEGGRRGEGPLEGVDHDGNFDLKGTCRRVQDR